MSVWAPPVSFFFKVEFVKTKESAENNKRDIPDISFQEVSGLQTSFEVESIEEGGENNFVHRIPVRVKHENLVLKRALEPMGNSLEAWIRDILESGFNKKIEPLTIFISLMGAPPNPSKKEDSPTPASKEEVPILASWTITNAYPVKWEISPLSGEKNELVIETLEFAYNELKRLK